jgi:hypothetical protein
MKYKLIVLNLVVLAGVCITLFSQQVNGTCSNGINKSHLDTNAGAFVDGTTLEIDSTNGVRIKDGGCTVSDQAEGNTNVSNNSYNTWQDVPDMSITLTTRGGNVLLVFSGDFKTSNSNTVYSLRFSEGANNYHRITRTYIDYNDNYIERPISMQYLVKGLSAGSHTFKVQWLMETSGHTVYQNGATYPRVFSAVEFRK